MDAIIKVVRMPSLLEAQLPLVLENYRSTISWIMLV